MKREYRDSTDDFLDAFMYSMTAPRLKKTKWQKFWYEVKWAVIIIGAGLWLGWFIHTWAMVIVINSLIK